MKREHLIEKGKWLLTHSEESIVSQSHESKTGNKQHIDDKTIRGLFGHILSYFTIMVLVKYIVNGRERAERGNMYVDDC